MLVKKISAIVPFAILMLLALSSFLGAWLMDIPFSVPEDQASGMVAKTEAFLSRAFPFSRTLKGLRIDLGYYLGTREQDQVFIAKHRLIENVQPPVNRYVQKNTDAIIDFAGKQKIPAYVMLIPTASAVLQNETPRFADANIYNQKQFIEERYKNFAGKLSCVDVYSTLRENSDKYIYYNTESLITMQGGHYLYDVLTRRMGNEALGLELFKIKHLGNQYYGSLYDRVESKNIKPDMISTYIYNKASVEFRVVQQDRNREKREYNTLYPEFLMDLNRPLDVYLGGMSAMVEIVQKQSPRSGALLVFGDTQMRSVLPFLACDYRRITMVDLSQMSETQIEQLDYSVYDAVLFAYSVDTFMHSDAPARMQMQQT